MFCAFGVVVGVYAESWDQSAFVTNLVILPLSFLGGVFYSVGSLPSPWQELSHANPLYYLIDAVRYGFLGTGDVPVGISLGVGRRDRRPRCIAWSAWLFATGRRLLALRRGRRATRASRRGAAECSPEASSRRSSPSSPKRSATTLCWWIVSRFSWRAGDERVVGQLGSASTTPRIISRTQSSTKRGRRCAFSTTAPSSERFISS